jgi:hypothetical protein
VGGQAGTELERSEFLLGERLAGERVVLAALDHRPAQAHQLPGGGDDRDLDAAPGTHSLIERAQRPRDLRRGERGLDEHPARVRSPVLGDPPVCRRLATGLLDPRVQAQIGDELLRAAEPTEVTDRC